MLLCAIILFFSIYFSSVYVHALLRMTHTFALTFNHVYDLRKPIIVIIIISFWVIVEYTHIQSALSDAVCLSNLNNFTSAKLTTINFAFIKLMSHSEFQCIYRKFCISYPNITHISRAHKHSIYLLIVAFNQNFSNILLL